jgi:hypothetical protein
MSSIMNDDSTELCSSFRLLLALPHALLHHIVVSFCTGKTISTLLQATRSCQDHRDLIASRRILRERVQQIMERTEELPSHRSIHEFLRLSIMEHENDTLGFLSTRLAVVDYFESALTTATSPHPDHTESLSVTEFPIWAGQLMFAFNEQSFSHETPWVQLSTPFWNHMLVGDYHKTLKRSFGLRVSYQYRNFRTVPPIGRIQGIRTIDQEIICDLMTRMETHGQVLAQSHVGTSVSEQVSVFLVTPNQARSHCPSILPDHLDPYNLKNAAAGQVAHELYCLWMQNCEDDELDVEYVVTSMVRLLNHIQALRDQATMHPSFT